MRFASSVICLCSLALFSAAMAVTASADAVSLKSGDHVSGTITGADSKTVTLKTDFAGEIKINWSAVQEITGDSTLYVVTPDKQTVNGPITIAGTDLIVHTKSSGEVRVALDKLSVVRSPDAEAAYEKSLHPAFTADWKGDVDAGFALARGNSETTDLNFGFAAARKTLNDQISTKATVIYSKNDAVGGGVTANEILGEARYDRNIYDDTLFGFGDGSFSHNALQGLNLQSIYTGGLGWHAIHTSETTFDVLAGINYTRQSYGTPQGSTEPVPNFSRNSVGATVGEDLKRELGKDTTFTEDFTFYPDLSNMGQYTFAFDAGAETKISKWLGWEVTFTDRYVSNPPIAGTKANDEVFSTGLTASFGK